ncbi:uncharacterized protein F4812DRAFT_458661 [Daldinia caldariorum]|uniref:uncharacterized protein n=1 Tax=Daldinia caldariorum TaxID=326644 RepID=UPI002007A9D6|nr:uncharacterized protein F4812DRAFT_458661 [Daldinia caldariorum]KAI1468229.1 hypothetical protein F4812DRAFT_458661 [Daldinia caldariorum]
MFSHVVSAFIFTAIASAIPLHLHSGCRDLSIPITVNVPRFIVNATVNDNWDAIALTLALTRRDLSENTDPLPIAGNTSVPVESKFKVGATLCGKGGPTLVLTHGILESKQYWQPTFKDAEKYDFVKAAIAAGYSVLSYDRIGVGSSSKVDALSDAQFQVEATVLDSLVDYARYAMNATKIALVGHSWYV